MRRLLLFLGLAVATGHAPLGAGELPWTRLPESGRLSDEQRQVVVALCDSTPCYYECTGSVTQCLTQEPPSRAALRIAAFVIRRVLAGTGADEIRTQLQHRAESAHPGQIFDIKVDGLVPLGDPQAPVKVVIYADYECPYCEVASAALAKIVAEMPHRVVVYFKNFPIKTHPMALAAATAGIAAERQGQFWPMHDLLFENRKNLSEEKIAALAAGLKLDMTRFARDRADSTVLDRIRAEKLEGLTLGIKATPGIFFDGKTYEGTKTYTELRDRAEEEIEMLALPVPRP